MEMPTTHNTSRHYKNCSSWTLKMKEVNYYPMQNSIIIGTRGSQLALWQAQFVKEQLENTYTGLDVQFKIIRTTGDAFPERSITGLGKGVFTKEIDIALLEGEIDLAVHSLKDLPTELPDGLCIAAIPIREDPRDVLITATGLRLEDLLNGAKVGTASPRRKAQLLGMRPDLQVVDIRGNVDTRLRKLQDSDLDAIILAAAGINRLRKTEIITQFFEVERMVPAPGQGALAIVSRQPKVSESHLSVARLLEPLNDQQTAAAVTAERNLLAALGGGCQVPIGAYARYVDGGLRLISTVCHPNGALRIFESADSRQQGEETPFQKHSGSSDSSSADSRLLTVSDSQFDTSLQQAVHLAETVAKKLRNNGATELLRSYKL
ncbi:hydroxymethylbilane synthase [Candidatus Poribacteria bacterium]|nr:hydroxymethylbilane synthase [Candidatus Poribacteria bacterium]